jgi:hypothetical protein
VKKCPTCDRTYADDTLSFCFDDGTLLSSKYDLDETLISREFPLRAQTDPGYTPDKSMATVVSAHRNISPPTVAGTPAARDTTSPHLIYAAAGLLAVVVIVAGLVWLISNSKTTESVGRDPIVSTPTPRQTSTTQVAVDAQFMWTDTKLGLTAGDRVSVSATGQATATTLQGDGAYKYVGPDGWGEQPQFYDNDGKPHRWQLVLGSGSSMECLMGKVGSDGTPFKVGSSHSFTASGSGRFYLGVNHVVSDAKGDRLWNNDERGRIWTGSGGSFDARIDIK